MINVEVKSGTIRMLNGLRTLAWVAFGWFVIETGALLLTYLMSFISQKTASGLYKGLDFLALKRFSSWHYSLSVWLMVILLAVKIYILRLAIRAMSKTNLANPFNLETAQILEKISLSLAGIWIIAIFNNLHIDWILKRTNIPLQSWAATEFLFMAVILFIISQIFKRGLETRP